MAENEDAVVESKATPEQQAAAEKIGWIPASRFKGNPETFVDADEYIKRGETVLPIVKEQNKRLHTEVELLKAAQAKSEAALAKANQLLEDIEERHSVETQKAVENARKELKRSLAAASEAGDHEAVAELTDQMTQLNVDAKPAAKKEERAPVSGPTAEQMRILEETKAWWNTNAPWFGVDRRRTALANGIAQELRDGGETAQGADFFKLVKAEVDKTFEPAAPRGDKVEGGRNGSDNDTRQGSRKGFNSLPKDARDACIADERRFVGEGKKYKTAAEWHAKYAEIYFGTEAS